MAETQQEFITTSMRDGKVRFTTEPGLPRVVAKALEAQAHSFYRYEVPKFRNVELSVVARPQGAGFRCEALMRTERGEYQSYAEHEGAQQSLTRALRALHTAIVRDFEHRAVEEMGADERQVGASHSHEHDKAYLAHGAQQHA